MALSKRAIDFLQQSERENLHLKDSEIREIFTYNNAPIFEPLIDFQKKFGGFIFYAGLEPIKFSIIKGNGGYPESSKTAVVEFEASESAPPKYFFDCASTLYQMQFCLDENGVYFEDYNAKASSFDKAVEHLALWGEMRNRKGFELLFRDRVLKTKDVDKVLNLEPFVEASDQYTLWFGNEQIYMEQWQGQTTIVASKNYPDKSKILAL